MTSTASLASKNKKTACTLHIEWFPWHQKPQRPQWPLQPQQPRWPQWPLQLHFIKKITELDVSINPGTQYFIDFWHLFCWRLYFWPNLRVISKNSAIQNSLTTFKPKLACIFLGLQQGLAKSYFGSISRPPWLIPLASDLINIAFLKNITCTISSAAAATSSVKKGSDGLTTSTPWSYVSFLVTRHCIYIMTVSF